jgi:hypothetical protein
MADSGRSGVLPGADRRDPAETSPATRTPGFTANPWPWAVTLTLAAAFLYLAWLTGGAITAREFAWDDNFISYIYSRNLAEGHGLRYNIDDPVPTEGFSSLTHVLLVALGFRFGVDPLVMTRSFSLVSFLLIPVALALGLSKLSKAPVHEALAVACASQFPYFLTLATPYHLHLGMETVLFMGSVACLAAWSLEELTTGEPAGNAVIRRAVFGCAAATLVTLGRPEGPLLVMVTLAVIPPARRFLIGAPRTRGDRAFLAVCAWTVAVLAVYLAWKQWYFGDVLPNPYYVKTRNAIMGSRPIPFPGWPTTRAFLELVSPWAALALALLVAARARGREIRALLAASTPGIVMVLLYARAIHEAAFHYRYEFPFLVYLNLLLGGAVCLLARRVRRAAPALLAAVAIGTTFTKYPREILKGKPTAFLRARAEDSRSLQVVMGKDLARTRLGRKATIALSAAGAIPYLSGFRALDVVGLNDPYLCGREPRSIEEVWAYIDRHRPDVLQSGMPPATRGIGLDHFDPVLDAPVFSEAFQGNSGSDLARYYDREKLFESLRREMIYIRDHYTFGAAYPTGKGWTILYLRRDSPHLSTIRQTLLSTSYGMNRSADLSRYFGNDPRKL